MVRERNEEGDLLEDICPRCGDCKLQTWNEHPIVVCFTCAWQIDAEAWCRSWRDLE